MNSIKRLYVEKKKPFAIEAQRLLHDLRIDLGIGNLESVRVINRYDISGISEEEYLSVRRVIFSEPPVDRVFDEEFPVSPGDHTIAVEYLPGQYDQRADSAAQCIQIITHQTKPLIATARVILLKGTLTPEEIDNIKNYLINPVDSRQASLEKPHSLQMELKRPDDVEKLLGFIQWTEEELEAFRQDRGLAMSLQDLLFCRRYFKEDEERDPTITEIKLLDTYWSDHCRHTTFETRINNVEFQESPLTQPVREAFEKYLSAYADLYPDRNNREHVSLMNIATMSMKEMKKKGKLDDMEVSGEVNACSIVREVEVNGVPEEWLVMFKNETHNHPTEIEPFGGAATCLGGAIRDPLSGRAYVYQAMRVTGCGNPLQKISDTLPGKLPQRKITTEAAHGYSSYGNQIGVPTGQVVEVYHQGYVAKRMEVGAVIGAVPRAQVVRKEPNPGDVILLLGGRTGRDGIGGATGSSKEHTEESIYTAGAEVQKGNPPEERKIQRLFRNPDVTKLIKKSNDFGAGGVSVAIGELADGLDIYLDQVPKKYEGLDGTELAVSESQERMAVVIAPESVETFKRLASEENLECSQIAVVTDSNRLKMHWREQTIVDIDRRFLNTNGVRQETDIAVTALDAASSYFKQTPPHIDTPLKDGNLESAWIENLKSLAVCSQKGLVERFDSNVGGNTLAMPFGGRHQFTPVEAMAAKIPAYPADTATATLMSFGFNPHLSQWSPFHGAVYAVVEAVAKIVAAGGEYSGVRMSLQEYFEKLGDSPSRWGKPFSALLGAYHAMTELGIAAIGGKDSMSGSFKDLDVPPTLIAFAVDTAHVKHLVSPEFKQAGSVVVMLEHTQDDTALPSFKALTTQFSTVSRLIKQGNILSARTVRTGGVAAALSEMAFGNKIGFRMYRDVFTDTRQLFQESYGSFLLEVSAEENVDSLFEGIDYRVLGVTTDAPVLDIKGVKLSLENALAAWRGTLEPVFPTDAPGDDDRMMMETPLYSKPSTKSAAIKIAKPRALVFAFPGTNSEYETQMAFERAGAESDIFVFRNLTPQAIDESLKEMRQRIMNSQILALPGGFSAGDEPDGSGKFISAVFRSPAIKDAVMELLNQRDGLMIGICNGFQALVKLGLVPYGEIRDMNETSPTLTFNRIGRHVSCMVRTRITSSLSPWFLSQKTGDIHAIPVSHGEGRFIATHEIMQQLIDRGQIATQYVDFEGKPSGDIAFNPNGSLNAVEGITSPDGRVLGKMGHSERVTPNTMFNIPGDKFQKLFQSGVQYFK